MKKKVRFIAITAVLVSSVCKLQAQQIGMPPDTNNWTSPIHKSCIGKIVSYEHLQLSQDFTVNVVCYFLDTTIVDSIVWKLPNGWVAIQSNNTMPIYIRGDSVVFSFTLSFPDTNNLPFYPQYVEMKLLTNGKDSSFQTIIMAGKVYFTPYNSVEIWNLTDFYDLKRNWLAEDSIAPPRIYIHRDSIPQSNLGNDMSIYERDSATWDHWWLDNFREIEIEGLAYINQAAIKL